MAAFARYFLELFAQIWRDIVEWFKGLWDTLFVNVFNNVVVYFRDILGQYKKDFGFMGWLLWVFSSLLIIALISFIFFRLYLLIRRYIIVRKTEIEKDDLREEIAILNEKVAQAISEKNSILALKVSQYNGTAPITQAYGGSSSVSADSSDVRFSKLAAIDAKYGGSIQDVQMTIDDMVTLPELIQRFLDFSCSRLHLYYKAPTIRYFFASMACSKIIILEGVSGTGKTSLPYAMSKFFKNNAEIVSVQPSWRDRAELLGYLNEFTKKFNETDFLKAVYEVLYRKDINYIVLDEMNLARIEYYFAEFLSIMEMPDPSEWKIDLVSNVLDDDPKMLINGKLLVPQNVWFIGTANKDDSTFTITDKVYDRAMPIEFLKKGEAFDAPPTDPINMSYEYLDNLFRQAKEDYPVSQSLLDKFEKLDEYMIDHFKLAFGNRILKQLYDFIPVFCACGGTDYDALDYMLARKVLRKFESLNLAFLKDELGELILELAKRFGKGKLPESTEYIKALQKMV